MNSPKDSFLREADTGQAPSIRPDSNKWGFSLEQVGSFRIRQVNYFDGEE